MAFFLAFASFAVMSEVGRNAVGPAIGDFVAGIVNALGDERLGVLRATSVGFELRHHGLEKSFDVGGGERGVGLGRRCCVGVVVFIVGVLCRIMLVDWHLIDELFQFFVDDVGDGGDG